VSGIVAELPSKRLLLKFVEAKGGYSLGGLPTVGGKGVGDNSNSELFKELRVHFRFTRNFQEVAAVLMQLVNSDFERGIILEAVARRQVRVPSDCAYSSFYFPHTDRIPILSSQPDSPY
jgi:hypothetical protein